MMRRQPVVRKTTRSALTLSTFSEPALVFLHFIFREVFESVFWAWLKLGGGVGVATQPVGWDLVSAECVQPASDCKGRGEEAQVKRTGCFFSMAPAIKKRR